MSALGQKRTLFTMPIYVRFTPNSGHSHRRFKSQRRFGDLDDEQA